MNNRYSPTPTDYEKELKQRQKEIANLKEENEILKRLCRSSRKPRIKFQFIENHHNEFSIVRMCRVLGVSKSGYYNWLILKDREPTEHELYREEVKHNIRQFFYESMGTYGAPRIHEDLIEAGYSVSEKTVGRYT